VSDKLWSSLWLCAAIVQITEHTNSFWWSLISRLIGLGCCYVFIHSLKDIYGEKPSPRFMRQKGGEWVPEENP